MYVHRASPSALEAFALRCSSLRTLQLGRLAAAMPRVLLAWAQQPQLSQVTFTEV